jgi:hypothetical protein
MLSRVERAQAITLELRGYAKTDEVLLQKLQTLLNDHRQKLNLRSLNLLEDKSGRKRSTAQSLMGTETNSTKAVKATKQVQDVIAEVAPVAPVTVQQVQWVACNDCEKWRQVPAEHAAAFPDEWRCADAEWASIACTDDEESWPAEGGGNDFTIYGQVQPVRGSKKRKESMHGTKGGKRGKK